QIANLPFVSEIKEVYNSSVTKISIPEFDILPAVPKAQGINDYYNYGLSTQQIKMLNGHILHNNGYRGQGMLIAVIDAGFSNANSISGLSSLWTDGRVVLVRDIVNPASNLFEEHSHGTIVLSALASYLPNELIGSAPEAKYALIRSEDTNSEQLIEEFNWVYAAQIADSIGADIINSSLGYYQFDCEKQNHVYEDMDGKTTPVARGANFAANKGILIVASAGNEQQTSWQKIVSPSDSPNAVAVGAVDADGKIAYFSSIGPSADGRIKPDVVAMGYGTAVQSATGQMGTANGTSLSAPIISGLAACLWQSKPNISARDIHNLIVLSSTNFHTPNNQIGYGLPNFGIALDSISLNDEHKGLKIFPNPTNGHFSVLLPKNEASNYSITIISSLGVEIVTDKFQTSSNFYSSAIPKYHPNGLYLINLKVGGKSYLGKIVKINNRP
ncbi:MAG: S8 family serine peptidase, partial [Bacteroidales bacterium]|nr:S8 family serine peptidase [Bacteroidales bacterium]